MDTNVAQRWREKRESYRPAGEVIDTARYEVAMEPLEAEIRDFVLLHHYSNTFPAARERVSLYRGGERVGAAIFSHPVNDKVLTLLPCERLEGVELGRFVLLEDVPGNGETWFLARCFELMAAAGYRAVVSFSDPMPRFRPWWPTEYDGNRGTIFSPWPIAQHKGHIGTIYQASNAAFSGRGTARTLRMLDDGTVVNARTIQKIRGLERNWQGAVESLVRNGAAPLTEGAAMNDVRRLDWLHTWLPRITRGVRHPGNLRYLFGLDRHAKRSLAKSYPRDLFPYPKFDLAPTSAPAVTLAAA